MSGLRVVIQPEKDWNFQVGDRCVFNSGSPLLTVVEIVNRNRIVSYVGDKGELCLAIFPSICLRPHFLDRFKIIANWQ